MPKSPIVKRNLKFLSPAFENRKRYWFIMFEEEKEKVKTYYLHSRHREISNAVLWHWEEKEKFCKEFLSQNLENQDLKRFFSSNFWKSRRER